MTSKLLCILIFVSFMVSCTSEVSKAIEAKQHDNIIAYIKQFNPAPLNIFGDLYRITVDEPSLSVGFRPRVDEQDSVYIDFVFSIFDNKEGRGAVFATNIKAEAIIANLPIDENGLIVSQYEAAPYGIKQGTSRVMNGLYYALNDSMERGSYCVVVPFEYAYGDEDAWLNTIPPYSTIFIEYTVVKINKYKK